MASSSSPKPEMMGLDFFKDSREAFVSPKVYDVFISHRGPDVKETLASHLHRHLSERECQVFLDKELHSGDSIPSSLRSAISSSKVQIAIFSKGYAESPWCLAELALMLQTEALFIPVFFKVQPSDLRHIKKRTGVYAKAFNKYYSEGRHLEKLDDWKRALRDASSVKGFELNSKFRTDPNFLILLSDVQQEVERRKLLDVATHPVGLDGLVADFERQCGQNGEEKNFHNVIGIYGMGGCGKTTLVKDLFNRKRSNYTQSCFIENVREECARDGLTSLQSRINKDLFREDRKFQNTSVGKGHLRDRLKRSSRTSRWLIVLDDIDDEDQLDNLMGSDALGPHSLLIITTRDKGVLIRAGITVQYYLKGMGTSDATELFCRHALKRPNPSKGYEDLVARFVEACQGLPLSLKVFGALVSGRDKEYWELQLKKVKTVLPEKIEERLRISFNALDREEKQIFLDIACFFIGERESMATSIWKVLGRNAEHAVQSLKEKCLVQVVRYEYIFTMHKSSDPVLRMHDHLRDMGRTVANEPDHPRRLWHPQYLKSPEQMEFKDTLKKINGRCFQSIFDQSIRSQVTYFTIESSSGSETPTWLWLELDLKNGRLESIPSWIPLQSLISLRIVDGHLTRLWQEDLKGSCSSQILPGQSSMTTRRRKKQKTCTSDAKVPMELRELFLDRTVLKEFPNILRNLIHLETLYLKGDPKTYWQSRIMQSQTMPMVIEGRSFSESLRKLGKLKTLVLWSSSLLGELSLSMSCLQTIDLCGVHHTTKISICGENCPALNSLRLDSLENLAELHLWNVTTLTSIHLKSCSNLKSISGFFGKGKLETLNVDCCWSLEEVPNLSSLSSLNSITFEHCWKLQNVNGIERLKGLKHLRIYGYGIWESIQRMERLPSESARFLGRAVDEVESILNANFFSTMVSPDAVTEVMSEDSGKIPDSLSAIVICELMQSNNLFTTVDAVQKHHAEQQFIYHCRWNKVRSTIKQKWVVTVKTGEEFKALRVFNAIIAKLYKKASYSA